MTTTWRRWARVPHEGISSFLSLSLFLPFSFSLFLPPLTYRSFRTTTHDCDSRQIRLSQAPFSRKMAAIKWPNCAGYFGPILESRGSRRCFNRIRANTLLAPFTHDFARLRSWTDRDRDSDGAARRRLRPTWAKLRERSAPRVQSMTESSRGACDNMYTPHTHKPTVQSKQTQKRAGVSPSVKTKMNRNQ